MMNAVLRSRSDRRGFLARRLRAAATLVLAGAIGLTVAPDPADAVESRIKDIADFEGIRDNLLIGYGLVVGLNGTGDDAQDDTFMGGSLAAMLERLGIKVDAANIDPDNVAAVMVTSVLPPFARQGTRIDVTVSAIGTSESLLGGTLLVTPMLGADGEVYAVAQGQVAVGGFVAQGAAQTVTRGVPTNGRVAGGAIIERELLFELGSLERFKVALRNPDLTTARRVASAINGFIGSPVATQLDSTTIMVDIPQAYNGDTVALMTDIEQLPVEPDQMARVIIDEQTGIIVMGENVRISEVAVAQGNLTVRVTETPQVSQPNPFAPGPAITALGGATTTTGDTATQTVATDADGNIILDADGNPVLLDATTGGTTTTAGDTAAVAAGAQTVVVDRTQIDIDAGEGRQLGVVPEGVTLQELVNGLNSLGIGPRDMISILQAIKASGALQAELRVL